MVMPSAHQALADFSAAVKLKFVQGDPGALYAYGLFFQQVNRDYAFFGLQNDGYFRLTMVQGNGGQQIFVDPAPAMRRGPGQINQIAVRTMGSDIICLVNDQVTWQFHGNIPKGQIGLGVYAEYTGGPAQVEFTDFELRAPSP